MKNNQTLSLNDNQEIKDFILNNSNLLYTYINTHILQDIAQLNFNYFENIIQRHLILNADISKNKFIVNQNLLPYFILTLIEKDGKIDYTSSRIDTIDFSQLNKESSVYYNYIQFLLKDDCLSIQLMQTKIGGMPIDEDIIKFTKNIPIDKSGFDKFILKNNH